MPGGDLDTAAAVAMAESGGDPTAGYPDRGVDHGDSIGLWQINVGNWTRLFGPDRGRDAYQRMLMDPNTNAWCAGILSGGGHDWRAWSTFNSGAYKRYMPGGS